MNIARMAMSLRLNMKLCKESWRDLRLSALILSLHQIVQQQRRVKNPKMKTRKQRKQLTAVSRKLRISTKMKVDNMIILIVKCITQSKSRSNFLKQKYYPFRSIQYYLNQENYLSEHGVYKVPTILFRKLGQFKPKFEGKPQGYYKADCKDVTAGISICTAIVIFFFFFCVALYEWSQRIST